MSAAKAEAGMPPYYVVAGRAIHAVQVRSSITGQILSEVDLPTGSDPKTAQIAGPVGGRFVLGLTVNRKAAFYILKVSDYGRSARLTSLAVPSLPGDKVLTALALSPDGAKLAIGLQFNGGKRGSIEVVTLATGAVRTWTTVRPGLPAQLSWTDHGRELGFFWYDEAKHPDWSPNGGLWLLNPRLPNRHLLSGRLVLPDKVGTDTVNSALFSPDGKIIDAYVFYVGSYHFQRGTIGGAIIKLSAQTGRPLSMLYAQRRLYADNNNQYANYVTGCDLVAADATGNHLLVDCDSFGRLDRTRFTSLSNSAQQATADAAW
jgi:hypothetical protein